MNEPIHCNAPAKPYFDKWYVDTKKKVCHSFATGFKCIKCGARILPDTLVNEIKESWANGGVGREALRLAGIEFDNSLNK